MRVDEARRDDRAAEVERSHAFVAKDGLRRPLRRVTILAGGGWLTPHPGRGRARGRVAGADLGDEAVLDPQPAALVLGAGVVHRDDPGVREDHADASSGTSSKRSTSTRPRSVSFSARDHREREEREVLERRLERRSRARRAAATSARLRATTSSSGASESRPATGSGSSASTLAPSTTTIPPPMFASRAHRERHRVVAHPDDDDVVRVVRDRRGERAAPEAEARARSRAPIRPVPRWRSTTAIFARSRSGSATASPAAHGRLLDERLGDDLARDEPDHARAAAAPRDRGRPRARARRRAPCAAPSRAPRRAGSRRPAARPSARARGRSARGRGAAAGRPGSRARSRRGARARATSAGLSVAQTSASSGGIPNATASRTIALMWPSSAMCSGSRSSVQNAIRCGPYSREQRQQRVQVPRRRRLADQQPHPGAQPLAALLDGRTPRGRSGSRRRRTRCSSRPRTPGAWPSTCVARARASRARAGRRATTPGKFIISASPITRRRRSSASRSPAVSSRRGDSKRDAGTHDEAMNQTSSGSRPHDVEQPVDAVGAEHVRDLVRVGDDRRRAEREHEPRELVDEQLRRLEVHVRVDEARARRSGRPRRRLGALVLAEPGDVAVDDRDVGLEPLAREDARAPARRARRGRRARPRARRRGGARCGDDIWTGTVQFAPWTCSLRGRLDEALRLKAERPDARADPGRHRRDGRAQLRPRAARRRCST